MTILDKFLFYQLKLVCAINFFLVFWTTSPIKMYYSEIFGNLQIIACDKLITLLVDYWHLYHTFSRLSLQIHFYPLSHTISYATLTLVISYIWTYGNITFLENTTCLQFLYYVITIFDIIIHNIFSLRICLYLAATPSPVSWGAGSFSQFGSTSQISRA